MSNLYKKILATFLFLILSANIQASSVDDLFHKFFYSDDISARHCGRNISLFMDFLTQNNVNIHDEIKIMYMTSPHHPWTFGMVAAVNDRWATPKESILHANYVFHVFAIYQGKVYDFHFTKSPNILPLQDYLEAMYIPSKAFAINGNTFRVRGMGPLYKPEHARDELKDSRWKIMKTDARGNFTTAQENVLFDQL